MAFQLEDYLEEKRKLIDHKLSNIIYTFSDDNTDLTRSIGYSISSGGKRLRPILCIATCETLGKDSTELIPIACAIEMIHTYSLIHDDLPSMDDDSLRRGKPTNHVVFGEATAILAGDALLADSFSLIAGNVIEKSISPMLGLEIIRDISFSAGSNGMVRGQSLDLFMEGRSDIDIEKVEEIHRLKTGSLISCAVKTGARFAGSDNDMLARFTRIGNCIGLAYQINDDILDIEGGDDFGKSIGSDVKKKKLTFPSVAGMEKAKKKVDELTNMALSEIEVFGDDSVALAEIIKYLGERKN